MDMMKTALDEYGIEHRIVGDPTLFDPVFTAQPVNDYRSWLTGDQQKNTLFNTILREQGIFKSPGKTSPSVAITADDLELTRVAVQQAAAAVATNS